MLRLCEVACAEAEFEEIDEVTPLAAESVQLFPGSLFGKASEKPGKARGGSGNGPPPSSADDLKQPSSLLRQLDGEGEGEALVSLDRGPPPTAPFRIFVVLLSGKTLALEVQALDTARAVREQIEAQERIPPWQQLLLFEGRQLADEAVLWECKVQPQAQLHLIRMVFRIFVRTLTGKSLTLEVGPLLKVREIKAIVARKEGIPIDQQGLIFNKLRLEDDRLLSSYPELVNDCSLYLVLRLGPPCKTLHVVAAEGGRELLATLQVPAPYLVEEVKRRLQEQLGLEQEPELQLPHTGQWLRNGKSLEEDYSLPKECTVHLTEGRAVCALM